jgi:oligopeptidase B
VRIVLATNNPKKRVELERILAGLDVELVPMGELGLPSPVEDGDTFEANALIKARAACAATGLPALADDSGLVVDGLGGEPGVVSSRWAGTEGDDAANNAKLVRLLADVPDEERAARFVAVAALVAPDGTEHVVRGTMEGRVRDHPTGDGGFGYDPYFVADGHDLSNAELAPEEKDAISHRGAAFRAVRPLVEALLDADGSSPSAPPVADREETTEDRHGEPSPRPYAWMKDRDDPRLRPLLEAENAWTRAQLAPLDPLRDRVYEEIVARVQQTDTSAPTPRGPWAYYHRTVEGLEQAIHCRVPRGAEAGGHQEQVLLDENLLAEPTGYCAIGALAVSPDHHLLAYAVDTDGAERFTLRLRDAATGEDLPDSIGPEDRRPVGHGLAWGSDSQHLYYTVLDEAHRPHQVWRHVVGTPVADDELVLAEPDDRYWMGVARERSGALVTIDLGSAITSEVHVLDATDRSARPVLVAAREEGITYEVEHRGHDLWVVHDADGATDFALARVALSDVLAGRGREAWEEQLPHRPGTRLLGVAAFADHLLVVERVDALPRVSVWRPWQAGDGATGPPVPIEVAGDDATVVRPGPNPEFGTGTVRLVLDSLVRPRTVVDVDLTTGEEQVVKRQPVPGYEPDEYATSRLWATSPDGARVPITIAHHVGVEPDGTNPCHVYGYGSYEITIDPDFRPTRLPLLDRGVVYAIVHVRGGGALGRRWYEQGKFEQKPNTFTDTLACVDHLVETGWAHPGRVSLEGRSAGGLLVGATINRRPSGFAAAVAGVPFVDCRATMWDSSIPLTVLEYDEWGDPAGDPAVDRVIASYTPTENIVDEPYPALLVTSGINDPRVAYWEPTMWVQEHRHVRSDDRPVLLRTELGAGHFGPSGRYGRWREEAEILAFVLHHLGAEDVLDAVASSTVAPGPATGEEVAS